MTELDPTLTIGELNTDQRIELAAQVVTEHSAKIITGEAPMMPFPLFKGWATGNVIPTVELGLVKPSETTDGSVDVYMWRRPANDPQENWRNRLHIPGVVLLNSDVNLEDETDLSGVIERVVGETEGGITMLDHPMPYATVMRRGGRGPEVTTRLLVPVQGAPAKGEFYDVTTMLQPPNDQQLLETHDRAIQGAQAAAHRLQVFPDLRPL